MFLSNLNIKSLFGMTSKPKGLSIFAWVWCLLIAQLPTLSIFAKIVSLPLVWLFGGSPTSWLFPHGEFIYLIISLTLLLTLIMYLMGYKIAQITLLLFAASIFITQNNELSEIMLFGVTPAAFLTLEQYAPRLQQRNVILRILTLLGMLPIWVICLVLHAFFQA